MSNRKWTRFFSAQDLMAADRSPNGAPLSRRAILRGSGLLMGLPLLDAMSGGRKLWAATVETQAAPVRMAFLYFDNGVILPKWKVQGEGKNWALSPTLAPLCKMQDKINVFSGLAHDNGVGGKDGAGDHARSAATFLTGSRPLKTSSRVQLGVSVDQLAASQLVGKTRLPSIELGLTGGRNAGSCDSGYSCAYSSNISWRNETQPMSKETTPRLAFERLFSSGDSQERHERNLVRQSILDVVAEDAKQLVKRVGDTDRRKLDEYFSGIREIELRIEQSEKEDMSALPDLEVPFGRVDSFREHAQLMFDILAVAFQTDSTRVATLMLDNAGGNRRYVDVGVKEDHHGLSHHQNNPDSVAKLEKIDHYLVQQYAYFLEKLDSIPEGEGSLLDNCMVLYGSGLSDGNRHRHDDLPIILGGGAGGRIETRRHIVCKDKRPMSNLFLSMLDIMGTPADMIGDSNGRLQELA